MRQTNSKSKRKSVKSKTRPRTPAQLKKDAARIFDIMQSAEVSDQIKYEIGCIIIEEIDGASIIERHKDLFAQAYTFAAREPDGDISELERILNRLDAGDQLADVVQIRETGQPQRPRPFAALAQHLSGILNDPNTPDEVYNALADKVSQLCNPYLQAIHETPEFIEKALTFAASGEASESDLEAKQSADLARLIHSVLTHPNTPDELREGIAGALVGVQNEVGAREITESLQGIRATLEQYERKEDEGNDTTDLQPRNKREEAIVDDVLEHAEEIRAARAACDARAVAIRPAKGGQG